MKYVNFNEHSMFCKNMYYHDNFNYCEHNIQEIVFFYKGIFILVKVPLCIISHREIDWIEKSLKHILENKLIDNYNVSKIIRGIKTDYINNHTNHMCPKPLFDINHNYGNAGAYNIVSEICLNKTDLINRNKIIENSKIEILDFIKNGNFRQIEYIQKTVDILYQLNYYKETVK